MTERNDELGALWIRRGSKGEFMTGTITIDGKAIEIVCFTNQHKKTDKHPDWRVLRSRPREQRENPLPDSGDLNPEDVPF